MVASQSRFDTDVNASEEVYAEERGRTASVSLSKNTTARFVHPISSCGSILLTYRDRIQNPLAGIPKDTLFHNVEEFCRDVGMVDHTALIQRGALVAQDPSKFEQIPELEESEREALRNEVIHKWRQPTSLYFTVILCSIGAAVQGWDQTGSNGANLSWPVAFGVPDSGVGSNAYNGWIVGVVNSGPYIGSAGL